ncbi:MAG: dUTPase [Thaumarchaeota archaeon]|nr:dUTPase [Nitrososphaerota archaeon]MCY3975932.1 dUTPase [Nitrososphaerota archaeon]
MKDKLESIFSLQKELSSLMDLSRYPNTMEEKISMLCIAIIHEAIELQRITNWKWWKKPTTFNIEKAKEELIDIWHFVIQASMELDLNPNDIVKEYKKKNCINRERQQNNY